LGHHAAMQHHVYRLVFTWEGCLLVAALYLMPSLVLPDAMSVVHMPVCCRWLPIVKALIIVVGAAAAFLLLHAGTCQLHKFLSA
jgi:hypothetical protein